MSESRNNGNGDDDFTDWSPWEQHVIMEIQDKDGESVYKRTTEDIDTKLLQLFQGAAQCLAILYKAASDPHTSSPALWTAFQAAAGAITTHHKACFDYFRIFGDTAQDAGSHRRTKEVLAWARRRRTVRREELIAFLAGKSPPPKIHSYRGSPRSRLNIQDQRPRPRLPPSPHHLQAADGDHLSTFREALGIGSPSAGVHYHHRRRPALAADVHNFINDEFVRNHSVKRPAPNPSPPPHSPTHTHDVTMDSPQHKRFKFT